MSGFHTFILTDYIIADLGADVNPAPILKKHVLLAG